MSQMAYSRVELELEKTRLSDRELLVMREIGPDMIDSASKFVDYMSDVFGFSKSSIWYTLNRLKERGLLDFASKSEVGKPLMLTESGRQRMPASARERHIGEPDIFSGTQLPMAVRRR